MSVGSTTSWVFESLGRRPTKSAYQRRLASPDEQGLQRAPDEVTARDGT